MITNLNGATLEYDLNAQQLVIIDQTLLPREEKLLYLEDKEEVFEAIKNLRVRGAPAIGVAAAIGMAVIANRCSLRDYESFYKEMHKAKDYLASSRPTAVNLFWALERMISVIARSSDLDVNKIKKLMTDEAMIIFNQDVDVCRRIGEHGAKLIKANDRILTHCNAGRLATVRYGTALAPVYIAAEQGKKVKVFADETRPLLQGARLTAYELSKAGIETTLICDNMAASMMKAGKIDAVFVGADRIATNNDVANKIGTLGVAICAKHFGIPFYVCAPTSTFDLDCPSGEDIVIEYRDREEITNMHYVAPMAPRSIDVCNPAFDVTDHELIAAIITENGLIYT